MNAIAQRFCEDYNVAPYLLELLVKKAKRCARLNTRCHNEPTFDVKVLDDAVADFEAMAKAVGFDNVDWPGLYPTVTKGKRSFIELPLDE